MRRLLFLLLCLSLSASATTTFTANLKDLATGAVSTNSFVRLQLMNCGTATPSIVSAPGVIVRTLQQFSPNGSGAVSVTFYSNDVDVSCGGQFTTYYQLTYFVNNVAVGPVRNIKLLDGLAFSSATAPLCATPATVSCYLNGSPASPIAQGPQGPAGTTTATGVNGNFTVPGTLTATAIAAVNTPNVNNTIFADMVSGIDACDKIHTALGLVPAGGVVDATNPSIVGTDCTVAGTPDPFIGITKAVRVKLGVMLNINRTWFLGRGSNQYLECTTPSAGLNQTAGDPNTWGQDRVIALDWNEPVDGSGLPPHSTFSSPINESAITGNIAVGATSFTSTPTPPAGAVAGAWIQVYTKESVLNDVIAFDMAQIASVVGNTVNVVRPFRTAFTENGTTPGTNNFYLVLSQASPTENVGVSGCTIKAVDLGAPAPGIAVMRVRNALVKDNVVQIINGQPIYNYRSVGAQFINNKFKGDSGIQESEFAESVNTIIDGLTCENEGTTAAFNCGVTFDFGFAHFRASNIHLDGSASSAGSYGALYGVHDGVLSNLTAGYSSGGVGFLSLGSRNLTLTTSRLLGAGGASTGVKFNDYVSAAVTLTSALNIIAFNRVDGYNTTYDVPNDTDLLVRDNTAGSQLFIHGLVGLERPEPSGMCSAAQDSFWPDSVSQRWKMCNHNGTRQFVAGVLTGSDAAVDLASVASGACTAERTVGVTGAAFGNTVQVAAGTALEAGTSLVGKVSSAGNTKWQFCNLSGGPVDRASDTYTITVTQ